MHKKTPRKKLISKLDNVFSQYIRLRESKNGIVECFTCGKKEYWKGKGMQNGHFMSRKHFSTRWDETNCQVQCVGCNVYGAGQQFIFSKNLDQKYGEGTAEAMLQQSRQTVKYSSIELEEKIKHYEHLVKSLI
jgi:hypothetical protein